MAVVVPGTGDTPVIEDGLYEVTCIDTEELMMVDKFSGGKERAKIKLHLQVHGTDDGEGEEVIIDPLLNLKWSSGGDWPASTLYLYAVALCGPQDGDVAFDTDNLKGKTATALTRTETAGAWPKVKEIMPLKKGVKNAPTQHVSNGKPLAEAGIDALTEAQALAAWFDAVKAHGYTPKEIGDHSVAKYQRQVSQLTASERDALALELQP